MIKDLLALWETYHYYILPTNSLKGLSQSIFVIVFWCFIIGFSWFCMFSADVHHHRWGLYGSDELQHLRHLQDHNLASIAKQIGFWDLGSGIRLVNMPERPLTCEVGSCLHWGIGKTVLGFLVLFPVVLFAFKYQWHQCRIKRLSNPFVSHLSDHVNVIVEKTW